MTSTNPRPEAALTPRPEEELSVDDLVVQEVSRHGPSSAADLLANVGAAPYAVIDATSRLFLAGVLRLSPDRQRFTLRRRGK